MPLSRVHRNPRISRLLGGASTPPPAGSPGIQYVYEEIGISGQSGGYINITSIDGVPILDPDNGRSIPIIYGIARGWQNTSFNPRNWEIMAIAEDGTTVRDDSNYAVLNYNANGEGGGISQVSFIQSPNQNTWDGFFEVWDLTVAAPTCTRSREAGAVNIIKDGVYRTAEKHGGISLYQNPGGGAWTGGTTLLMGIVVYDEDIDVESKAWNADDIDGKFIDWSVPAGFTVSTFSHLGVNRDQNVGAGGLFGVDGVLDTGSTDYLRAYITKAANNNNVNSFMNMFPDGSHSNINGYFRGYNFNTDRKPYIEGAPGSENPNNGSVQRSFNFGRGSTQVNSLRMGQILTQTVEFTAGTFYRVSYRMPFTFEDIDMEGLAEYAITDPTPILQLMVDAYDDITPEVDIQYGTAAAWLETDEYSYTRHGANTSDNQAAANGFPIYDHGTNGNQFAGIYLGAGIGEVWNPLEAMSMSICETAGSTRKRFGMGHGDDSEEILTRVRNRILSGTFPAGYTMTIGRLPMTRIGDNA